MPRAQASIDLGAIAGNIAALRRAAEGRQLMALVKADAYGHGALQVAPAARAAGADWLGVALPSEAVALRAAGDSGRLMAWLYTPGDDLIEPVALDVDLSASSTWHIQAVEAAARRTGRCARLHLKVDTGLGRGGASLSDWASLVESALTAQSGGRVEVVGIWSHLACADEPDLAVTRRQCRVFAQALDQAQALGLSPEVRHIASSGATLLAPESHYDMVRCGISVYGLSPSRAVGSPADLGLRPAMTVTAEVANVKKVPAGQGVSYGLRYHTVAPTTLALIPVGYADGVPRNASGKLPVSINGRRYEAAGTIAMDQFVVDVGDADVAPGDSVVLFGPDDAGGPSADDWADASGSIVNEIVTRIGSRIPRSFVGGGVARPSSRQGGHATDM